jgi:electron transport complex protein RnfC
MEGAAVTDLDVPINASTRSLLAFRKFKKVPEMVCVGCGKCARKCPMRLVPCYIHSYFAVKNIDMCKTLMADKCVGCGICSYLCPSEIPLAESVKQAKITLRSGQ